jgi:lysozyme
MARTLSPFAAAKIKQWEGDVPYVYDDFKPKRRYIKGTPVAGTLTAGVGRTNRDIMEWIGKDIPDDVRDDWFREDIANFCGAVDRLVTVKLNDNQFGALVSFAFNIGVGGFQKSTLLKKLNGGDYACVPRELAKYTRSKGKVLEGLVNRRTAEAGLWTKGSYVSSANVDVEAGGSVSAKFAGVGTGVAASSGGALGLLNETKEQISPFADISYIQYVLVFLAVIGLAFTGYAAYKRHKDAKA